jgi:hypothetical protein
MQSRIQEASLVLPTIKMLDVDGDGIVSPEEIKALILKMPGGHTDVEAELLVRKLAAMAQEDGVLLNVDAIRRLAEKYRAMDDEQKDSYLANQRATMMSELQEIGGGEAVEPEAVGPQDLEAEWQRLMQEQDNVDAYQQRRQLHDQKFISQMTALKKKSEHIPVVRDATARATESIREAEAAVESLTAAATSAEAIVAAEAAVKSLLAAEDAVSDISAIDAGKAKASAAPAGTVSTLHAVEAALQQLRQAAGKSLDVSSLPNVPAAETAEARAAQADVKKAAEAAVEKLEEEAELSEEGDSDDKMEKMRILLKLELQRQAEDDADVEHRGGDADHHTEEVADTSLTRALRGELPDEPAPPVRSALEDAFAHAKEAAAEAQRGGGGAATPHAREGRYRRHCARRGRARPRTRFCRRYARPRYHRACLCPYLRL